MIIYTIKQFWNMYGWYFIFFGSIFILLILWFLNSSKGSTATTLQSIFKKIFSPIVPNIPQQIETPTQPQKRVSKGEKKCKEFLEYLFNKPFVNVRPDYMINPITNQALELDCFNEELKLAIEYQGQQHYHYNKMMHQNSKHCFQNQQYRDHIKRDLCKQFGINLIEVPYNIPEEKIPDFLYQELRKHGYINSALINY
jgi:hypothetical protein